MTAPLAIDPSLRDRFHSRGDGAFVAEIPPGWAQGRATFGGLTAAYATALARRAADPRRRLRHAAFSLLRPVAPGPVEGRAAVAHTGRSAQFVSVALSQEDRRALEGRFVFVRERNGGTTVAAPAPPKIPPPEELPGFPEDDPLAPQFLQHVEVRLASRHLPFRGGPAAELDGYCRFRVPTGGEEGLVALVDIWPCPSLCLLPGPAPASTVTWSLHLLRAPPASFEGYHRYRYRTFAASGGFHTSVGVLYDAAGRAVAHSEQLVAVFDGREGHGDRPSGT